MEPPLSPDPIPDLDATSVSLLTRLHDLGDESAWRHFFDRYWKLIYNFSRRSGLGDADAQDIVQQVMVNLTTALPKFEQDPQRGRFKTWLLTIVKRRIIDLQRRRGRRPSDSIEIEQVEGNCESELEERWDDEWRNHVLNTAMERVRACVSARQFLTYDLLARQGASVAEVCRALDINAASVYLAKHRVGKLMRREIERLEAGRQ
jgi:RNA polymerase sigma-70 factor (ECF subfamily)